MRRERIAAIRSFEGCASKVVTYDERLKASNHDVSLFAAKVECPGGADGAASSYSNGMLKARRELAVAAGSTACQTCMFATMSKLDYTEHQIQQEDAQIRLLQARQRRLEIEAALSLTAQQLEQLAAQDMSSPEQ